MTDLSHDPTQTRKRMSRNQKRMQELIDRDLAKLNEADGYKPVSEWDLEELTHGRPRAHDGSFRGRRPAWVTPVVQREVARRLHDQAAVELAGYVGQAIAVLGELLVSEDTDARLKASIAQFTIEHVLGKAKVQVDLTDQTGWRDFIAGALVMSDGTADYTPVIEGEADWGDDE